MDSAIKILVVDDSRSVRQMFSAILSADGYTVTTAANGQEALSLLDGNPDEIDLIVSDINMPEMDGIALIKELHRRELDLPVVMVTSDSTLSVAVDALKNGATDYILKDGHINETIAITVRRTLERHQLMLKNLHLEQLVEQEVRKNREKDIVLMQRDKLSSIGQLAAGIAHEINNPMGFIISNLETLGKYAASEHQFLSALKETLQECCSEEQRKLLDELSEDLDLPYILEDIPGLIAESLEGAGRVKRIVLDLKNFTQVDQHCLIPVDINDCITNTINIVHHELKHVDDIALHLGELPQVVCYAHQINQVIANLLQNAAQAITGNGIITVSTYREEDMVIIEVCDTGVGMTEEVRSRLFEPFFTTREIGKGIGLGLAVSYDIINKHGGEISAHSVAGFGTTFRVRLPIHHPQEVSK